MNEIIKEKDNKINKLKAEMKNFRSKISQFNENELKFIVKIERLENENKDLLLSLQNLQ
jgi:chromosome segregation ATPase